MTYYSYAEQVRHYRIAAWDRGCTCPELPPHIHLVECPLYETPGGVPTHLHEHRDSPAAGPAETAAGVVTEPGEDGPRPLSPGAGDIGEILHRLGVSTQQAIDLAEKALADDYLAHLDQEHDADEGKPWV